MTFDNGVEAEIIALNGWLECDMPLNTQIGNITKGEIIEKLKQTIEDYERKNSPSK